jgi:hypothetical protein
MNELYLEKNSYLNFDAVNLKSLIVDRLNKGKVFTDQNYQGSNLSAVIDVVSLVFGNLMFYLNKTSSESMFTEAQLYENMNRIVKLLNYKPVGKTASVVPIRITAKFDLPPNNYTIPRYSYIRTSGSYFSFTEDVSFTKTTSVNTNTDELISSMNDKVLLKQGIYQQYPIYSALGTENESVYLTLDEKTTIDHYSIDVYVKERNTTKWVKYKPVNELFLHTANDTVYEFRYNENRRYEITFGNDINGRKLNQGDEVLLYYLVTDNQNISVGAGSINRSFIVNFNSPQFGSVLDDTNTLNANYISIDEGRKILISNAFPATDSQNEETVDQIRFNAPQAFRSQYRLVTKDDYEFFIKNTHSSIVRDVKIMNNNEYLMKYMKYLYNIGLKNPHTETNILFNQVKFSNACNFNNVYFCAIPKVSPTAQAFLNPPQKEIIINSLEKLKTITTDIVPLDPVYMMFDFFVPPDAGTQISLNDLAPTILRVHKSINSTLSDSQIISQIKAIIDEQFSPENARLGQFIDINRMTSEILALDDVDKIETYNSRTGRVTDGIVLLGWNYYYQENDRKIYTQNVLLEDFKYPIFNNLANIQSQIQIYKETVTQDATQF